MSHVVDIDIPANQRVKIKEIELIEKCPRTKKKKTLRNIKMRVIQNAFGTFVMVSKGLEERLGKLQKRLGKLEKRLGKLE